jgi:hypothetical protein
MAYGIPQKKCQKSLHLLDLEGFFPSAYFPGILSKASSGAGLALVATGFQQSYPQNLGIAPRRRGDNHSPRCLSRQSLECFFPFHRPGSPAHTVTQRRG